MRQRLNRGERVTSSATSKPSLLISSGELVSIVKLEPAGTVSEIDRTVARMSFDLTVKLDNSDDAVASINDELSAAVRDFDWTIAGSKRDLAVDSIEIQRTITG